VLISILSTHIEVLSSAFKYLLSEAFVLVLVLVLKHFMKIISTLKPQRLPVLYVKRPCLQLNYLKLNTSEVKCANTNIQIISVSFNVLFFKLYKCAIISVKFYNNSFSCIEDRGSRNVQLSNYRHGINNTCVVSCQVYINLPAPNS